MESYQKRNENYPKKWKVTKKRNENYPKKWKVTKREMKFTQGNGKLPKKK
jgi:hypothetical protein